MHFCTDLQFKNIVFSWYKIQEKNIKNFKSGDLGEEKLKSNFNNVIARI